MTKKLALGTVQFGLDYGISNKSGRVSNSKISEILDFAHRNSITTLDTAYNYGESENALGAYLQKSQNSFNIISKLPQADYDNALDYLKESLKRLNVQKLYGYLFHFFDTYKYNPEILEQLNKMKKDGIIEKVGFSLYYPGDLDLLFKNNVHFDLVQIPFSVFDQRFLKSLKELKKRNVEIHVRSVFLQGLVFLEEKNIDPFFDPIKDKLRSLAQIATDNKVSIESICLNFAGLQNEIDKIVIGVENSDNLKQNIESLNQTNAEIIEKLLPKLNKLSIEDERFILPMNWRK